MQLTVWFIHEISLEMMLKDADAVMSRPSVVASFLERRSCHYAILLRRYVSRLPVTFSHNVKRS
jgi:hypothetical protein